MRVDLDRRLDDWVGAQLISPDQADAIRARERAAGGGDSRLPLVAEALGYVGATLALTAVGILLGQYWDRFADLAQQLVAGLLTLLLLGAGWTLRERSHPAIQRLVSLLWFLGVSAFAWTVGLVAYRTAGIREAALGITVGAAVAVVGGVLWRLRSRSLQLIAMTAGVLTVAVSLLAAPDAYVGPLFFGVAVYGLGLVWALLGWGEVLTPSPTALVLGFLGLGVGAQIMAIEDPWWWIGSTVGIVTAGALVVGSVLTRRVLLLAFGAVGIFVFVPELIFRLFADTLGAPITLLVTGMLLVVAALGLARLKDEVTEEPAPDREEVTIR